MANSPHPKLPPGWTLRYDGLGVFPGSRQYSVKLNGVSQYTISVDRPGSGSRITIQDHIRNIWHRELAR